MKSKIPLPHGNKYITRIDCGNSHGNQVRIGQYIPSFYTSKFFSESKYKSKAHCLQAAKRWRNKEFRNLPDDIQIILNLNPNQNKYWGEGVYCVERINADGASVFTWVGSYYKDKKRKRESYSSALYGFERAERLARQFRNKGIKGKTKRTLKNAA